MYASLHKHTNTQKLNATRQIHWTLISKLLLCPAVAAAACMLCPCVCICAPVLPVTASKCMLCPLSKFSFVFAVVFCFRHRQSNSRRQLHNIDDDDETIFKEQRNATQKEINKYYNLYSVTKRRTKFVYMSAVWVRMLAYHARSLTHFFPSEKLTIDKLWSRTTFSQPQIENKRFSLACKVIDPIR